jgi:hypothetical protein
MLAGCSYRVALVPAPLPASMAAMATPNDTLATYFQAMREIDANTVLDCLLVNDDGERCAALRAMKATCPLYVYCYAKVSQPIPDFDAAYYVEMLVDSGAQSLPGQTIYAGDRATVSLRVGKIVEFRKRDDRWKIVPSSIYGKAYAPSKFDAGEYAELQTRLNELRALNREALAGRYPDLKSLRRAVQRLGFDAG